jgi:DNA-binding response OmpR family regulator
MVSKLLIVEDETGMAATLRDRMRKSGFTVTLARTGHSGLDLATREQFDLIILDIMLPEESGLQVCQKLRASGLSIPILMLSGRHQAEDKVAGLKAGGDDYLAKPFQMAELLARVAALLRRARAGGEPTDYFQFGTVTVNLRNGSAFKDGQPVDLTSKEFKLLRYFAEHRGVTVSREELMREVWGYGAGSATVSRTVDVHVTWLRQKLEGDPKNPQMILTVLGLGYKCPI